MINNYQNVSLPPKVTRNSNSINIRQPSQNQTVLPKEPKEIIKKGFFSTGEPYIFFGYDPKMEKYRFVCYNRNPFSLKKLYFF